MQVLSQTKKILINLKKWSKTKVQCYYQEDELEKIKESLMIEKEVELKKIGKQVSHIIVLVKKTTVIINLC